MKRGEPRTAPGFLGGPVAHYLQGTWLEAESFCYPNGGMTRRAKALFPDGRTRIVRCGLPDTFFSIPAAGGYLCITNNILIFHPRAK